MIWLLRLALLVIVALIGFLYFLVPVSAYKGPPSDHFNGETFFNPEYPGSENTFLDLLKWQWNKKPQPWPVWLENAPYAPVRRLTGEVLEARFISHATVLLQSANLAILTDPVWSQRISPFKHFGPTRVRNPGLPFDKLPPIDIVLISHNHYDHLDIPTLVKLEKAFHPVFLVPLGDKALLEKYGIQKIIECDWWQSFTIKNAQITFLPARHWSARWLTDKNKTLWGSYGIELANKKIYFAGDTAYASHFKEIRKKWGKPYLALLPIGSYEPRWFMKRNHLDPDDAVKAHLTLGAKVSIPIHYGSFRLGDEGIKAPIEDLESALKARHLKTETFMILPEGQVLTIN